MIEPVGRITDYQTYAVRADTTLMETITCEQADCLHYRHGWVTVIDTATALGQRQSAYIRNDRSRRHTVTPAAPGSLVLHYAFEPGQQCFTVHRRTLRPELYVLRDGDRRGNPTGRVRHLPEQSWLDSFGEHQEKIIEEIEKG